MPKQKNENSKRRKLLRRVRRQRLRYITILPSLITLLNGVCGFASIAFASNAAGHFSFHKMNISNFAVAGYLIFFAMIADMLDGRVARMSHTTSSFGGQLDSLCDMISFGVAPAFLVLKILEYKFTPFFDPAQVYSGLLVRFIWLAAGVYMICAAIRLARFNVENEEDETAHMSFTGLPTPAAAGVLASLVVFYEDKLATIEPQALLFTIAGTTIMYLLPFIAMGIAILMIGRIRYPHIINQYLKGRKPVTHLLWAGVIFSMIFLGGLPIALLLTFCGFALIGFIKWFYYKIILSSRAHHTDTAATTLHIADMTNTDT